MKITLRFETGPDIPKLRWLSREQRRTFEVPNGADITKVLPQIYGRGLAKYVDTLLGPEVFGDYMRSGKLEADITYNILSKNIPKTIKALDQLSELQF